MAEPRANQDERDRGMYLPWLLFVVIFIAISYVWFRYPDWAPPYFGSREWGTLGQIGDTFGALNALFSGLAFAALIIAVILQTMELRLQRKELKDTRRVLDETAAATRASADALPKIERAYVFANVKLQGGRLTAPRAANPNTMFVAAFFNHGKTPAIITMLRGYSDLVETIPEKLSASQGDEERLPEGLVIASGDAYALPVERAISDIELGQIERKEKTLICYGLIEYKDILGQIRETGFCWEFQQRGDGVGSFKFCSRSKLNYHT